MYLGGLEAFQDTHKYSERDVTLGSFFLDYSLILSLFYAELFNC